MRFPEIRLRSLREMMDLRKVKPVRREQLDEMAKAHLLGGAIAWTAGIIFVLLFIFLKEYGLI